MAPGLWHRTWYGSTSDRMSVLVPVYVNVCVDVCPCCVHVQVKSRTDINLASVLCPGVLDSEVFEGLLSQQIKAVYSNSFPWC